MSKYEVQNPISAGQLFGNYNASAVNDTDWHTLTSNEFYSSNDGSQFANNNVVMTATLPGNSSDSSEVHCIQPTSDREIQSGDENWYCDDWKERFE